MNLQLIDWNFKICFIRMRLITQYFLTLCWAKVIYFFFQAKGILHLSVLQRALNCNSTALTSPNSFQQKISKLPDASIKQKTLSTLSPCK